MSQEMVDQLNGGGMNLGDDFCTKDTPWVKDEAVSIADLTCGSDFPKIGKKVYEIVSVVDDVMRMSGEGNGDNKGDTAETRPTVLSTGDADAFKKAVAE